MKTIAHISDLHFGRIDSHVCAALAEAVRAARPDLVAVSGDMTQRARTAEFEAARAFLTALPTPQLVVPGNHDVPLYNLFMRMVRPLARYRRYIAADVNPFHADADVAIAGINTARSWTFKDGRINPEQLERVTRQFRRQPDNITRIVVTHHPFEGASHADDEGVVGHAHRAMQAFARNRIDVILSGHLHVNRIGTSAVRYDIDGYSALLIQAGTAISSRRREEANSFNILRVRPSAISLECRVWDPDTGAFVTGATYHFRRGAHGWTPAPDEDVPALVQTEATVALQAEPGDA